ncbi:MAG: hypothetical protein RR825_08135, partial [Ruthenibacterium sp.]
TIGAVVVGEMEQDETTLVAADDATGSLLEAELQPVTNAEKVFDFGQNSFRNARMADKIADAALMDDEESEDPIQLSADRSFAARKCTKSDFGVSIVDVEGGKMVCAAVTYGKMVYVRCIRPAPDAGKAAAMTALDMIRRLTLGMPISYARAFKAGQEIDWNEPMQQKGGKSKSTSGKSSGSKPSGGKKNLAVPIVLLVLVAIALCVAIWYVVNTFIIKDEGSMPVDGGMSMSVPMDGASVPTDVSVPAADTGAVASPAGSTAAPDAAASGAASTVTDAGAGTGAPVVHPFS